MLYFFLLVFSFLASGCEDILYVSPEEQSDVIKVAPQKSEQKDSPLPSRPNTVEKKDFTSEEWPSIRVMVNPDIDSVTADTQDIGNNYSIYDLFSYKSIPELANGYVYLHAIVTNLEQEPIDLNITTEKPDIVAEAVISYGLDASSCRLNDSEERSEYLNDKTSISKIGYRVFRYQNQKIGEEIFPYRDGFNFVKIMPAESVVIKWVYSHEIAKMWPLPSGRLPYGSECEADKRTALKSCDKKASGIFFNLCDRYSKYPMEIRSIRTEVFSIFLRARKFGTTGTDDLSYLKFDLTQPTRVILAAE